MNRTWKDNAVEFGSLTKQGYGVRLAVLVACSVESVGRGNAGLGISGKVTQAEFALV